MSKRKKIEKYSCGEDSSCNDYYYNTDGKFFCHGCSLEYDKAHIMAKHLDNVNAHKPYASTADLPFPILPENNALENQLVTAETQLPFVNQLESDGQEDEVPQFCIEEEATKTFEDAINDLEFVNIPTPMEQLDRVASEFEKSLVYLYSFFKEAGISNGEVDKLLNVNNVYRKHLLAKDVPGSLYSLRTAVEGICEKAAISEHKAKLLEFPIGSSETFYYRPVQSIVQVCNISIYGSYSQ